MDHRRQRERSPSRERVRRSSGNTSNPSPRSPQGNSPGHSPGDQPQQSPHQPHHFHPFARPTHPGHPQGGLAQYSPPDPAQYAQAGSSTGSPPQQQGYGPGHFGHMQIQHPHLPHHPNPLVPALASSSNPDRKGKRASRPYITVNVASEEDHDGITYGKPNKLKRAAKSAWLTIPIYDSPSGPPECGSYEGLGINIESECWAALTHYVEGMHGHENLQSWETTKAYVMALYKVRVHEAWENAKNDPERPPELHIESVRNAVMTRVTIGEGNHGTNDAIRAAFEFRRDPRSEIAQLTAHWVEGDLDMVKKDDRPDFFEHPIDAVVAEIKGAAKGFKKMLSDDKDAKADAALEKAKKNKKRRDSKK